jgi:type II restriction enzyme
LVDPYTTHALVLPYFNHLAPSMWTIKEQPMDQTELSRVIERYKTDPESVYATWFLSSAERMKAFRSIRRGVRAIAESITDGSFGTDFKGSPLEFVLTAITEQKQVFEGAAHPFYWKPKLRIPDIYENEANKRLFGSCLAACLTATREAQVLAELSRLANAQIKGLGPSVANIIYFLHPTIIPPFNTAMVNGFNALFGDKKKLGSWDSYFGMRAMIMETNAAMRNQLSKDLGAFAGLLFEIGVGRLAVAGAPDPAMDETRERAEKAARLRHTQIVAEQQQESEHTRMQYLLTTLGRALNYDVYVARNDRHRSYQGTALAPLTLASLPALPWPEEVLETVGLIDVIWFERGTSTIACAFEVEKSTSIYSGILRLQDLARSIPDCACHFYLLAPLARAREVTAQFARPALRQIFLDTSFAFISFEDLGGYCDALCRIGEDHRVLQKIVHSRPAS